MSQIFHILSLDGGGFRGAYSAYLLKRMEVEWGNNWLNQFHMYAGTSTGSIIAAGLAVGFTAEKIFDLYNNHGATIFKKSWISNFDLVNLFKSRYNKNVLRDLLVKFFGDITLGQVSKPLIIPAIDIGSGQVHVFKSTYDKNFVRDAKVLLVDAVLASCCAPTYFDPHIVGPYPLADGGVWANNPSLVSVIDAKRRLGIKLEDIRVFSIGTGKSKVFYPYKSNKFFETIFSKWTGWGFATRWGNKKFINLLLNLQADSAQNMLRLLLQTNNGDENQLLRINFESDMSLDMDDPQKLPDLIRQADLDFTHNAIRIKSIFRLSDNLTKIGD